jgi:small nuclear ribonucleoprotein (snRNP)-like protein
MRILTTMLPSGSPTTMSRTPSSLLESLIGQVVVVDLRSTYVCLGTLVACDGQYLEMRDADLHDFRDSTATREVYTYDSVRFGIRRNRARTLIRQDDVVAISRFDEIAES